MVAFETATTPASSGASSGRASRLARWTDAFLPADGAELSPDGVRRARLAIVTVVGIAVCCLLSLAWLLLNGVVRNVVTVSLLLGASAAMPFVLKRTGSLAITGHGICAVVAIGLALLMFDTGGRTFPPFALLPGVPLIATLIAGNRAGLTWSIIALGQIALFFHLTQGGLQPRIPLSEAFLEQGRYTGAAFMVVFLGLLAQGYESLKNGALEALAEERRRQLELHDRFLSHVSHELRTPLAAAHQFVSLVYDGVLGEPTSDQRETLEHGLRNLRQLERMIHNLVDVTRAQAGALHVDRSEVALAEIVSASLEGQRRDASRRGIALEARLSDDLPTADCDPTRTGEILAQLLDNAIKFTPEGGNVEVSACRDPERPGYLRIRVSDDGCGIDEARLERSIDEPQLEPAGEWRSRNGLGVGLAIARELVRLQGGRLWAQRRPAAGSDLNFTLPVYPRETTNQEGRT
jgi:signal transduction histidine kinase